MSSNSPRSCLVPSNSPRTYPVYSNSPRFCLVSIDSPRSSMVSSNSPRFCQVYSNSPRMYLVYSNSPRFCLVSSNSMKSYLVNLAPALVVVGADHGPLVQQHLGAGLVGVVGHAVVERRQPSPVLEVRGCSQVQQRLHGQDSKVTIRSQQWLAGQSCRSAGPSPSLKSGWTLQGPATSARTIRYW